MQQLRQLGYRTRLAGNGREALAALDGAGGDGLTAREVSILTDMPVGTASGRLSIMKQEGMIRHDPDNHKYFAIHSTREDNNLGYQP